jgi:hypothetical protein
MIPGGIMKLEIISFCLGAILVLIAVVGGGMKIKELSIPKVNIFARIVSGIMGFVFLSLSIGGKLPSFLSTGGTGPDPNKETQTGDPTKFSKPTQLYPRNGAYIRASLPPKLSWKEVPGATSYQVDIEYKSGDEWKRKNTVGGLKSTTYTLKDVRPPIRLRWRVWAKNSISKSSSITDWQEFSYIGKSSRSGPITKLSKPKQLSPRDKSRIKFPQRPVLKWTEVPGAWSYSVIIYEFKSDKLIPGHWVRKKEPIKNIKTNTYTLTEVRAPTPVGWSVFAVDSAGFAGPKTDIWQFNYIR